MIYEYCWRSCVAGSLLFLLEPGFAEPHATAASAAICTHPNTTQPVSGQIGRRHTQVIPKDADGLEYIVVKSHGGRGHVEL